MQRKGSSKLMIWNYVCLYFCENPLILLDLMLLNQLYCQLYWITWDKQLLQNEHLMKRDGNNHFLIMRVSCITSWFNCQCQTSDVLIPQNWAERRHRRRSSLIIDITAIVAYDWISTFVCDQSTLLEVAMTTKRGQHSLFLLTCPHDGRPPPPLPRPLKMCI